jgi:hypothetical protein
VKRGQCSRWFSAVFAGHAGPVFGRWKRNEKHRAPKQQGDPDGLARAGDPRGGPQDESYRTAGAGLERALSRLATQAATR